MPKQVTWPTPKPKSEREVLVRKTSTPSEQKLFITGFVDKGTIFRVEQFKIEIIFSPK